MRASKIVNC